MSDYPMLISNKLHSFRNFVLQTCLQIYFFSSSVKAFSLVLPYRKLQKTTKYKLFISFPPFYMNKLCIFARILKEN